MGASWSWWFEDEKTPLAALYETVHADGEKADDDVDHPRGPPSPPTARVVVVGLIPGDNQGHGVKENVSLRESRA